MPVSKDESARVRKLTAADPEQQRRQKQAEQERDEQGKFSRTNKKLLDRTDDTGWTHTQVADLFNTNRTYVDGLRTARMRRNMTA